MRTVEGQVKDPVYFVGETMYVDPVELENWTHIPFFINPDRCHHTDTICQQCFPSWASDWNLRVMEDGVEVVPDQRSYDPDEPDDQDE